MGYFIMFLILGVIAMAIYFGSSKIGKVFVGSTEIGKVYHGSTLVFQNLKKLPIYGYGSDYYILGSNSTSGLVVNYFNSTLDTIVSITGTLGASGSKIKVSSVDTTNFDVELGEYSYNSTVTFNGVKVHIYVIFGLNGKVFNGQYVIEDAVVGSKCLHIGYGKTGYPDNPNVINPHPSSVTSSDMTYRSTQSRNSSRDSNFTRQGLKN